ERLADHALGAGELGDVVGVGRGLATGGADLVHDLVGRACRRAGAVACAAEVVDDDLRAVRRQHERVLAADATARARRDHPAAFAELCHGGESYGRARRKATVPRGRILPGRKRLPGTRPAPAAPGAGTGVAPPPAG